jgi:tRNA pseudouridine55 synthase
MLNLPLEELITGTVLNINKPLGWTSFDVVKLITAKYKCKAGHAGTLDPMATGVLVVCTGKKTKVIDSIQALTKEYLATVHIGISRPSFDIETAVHEIAAVSHITIDEIKNVLQTFIGKQEQVAPLFSAKKINGVPVYELARKGIEKELKANIIEIYNIDLISSRDVILRKEQLDGVSIFNFKKSKTEVVNPECGLNLNEIKILELELKIKCSKGTYIRSIARDLALKLNSVGTLNTLIRTAVGDYKVEHSIQFD